MLEDLRQIKNPITRMAVAATTLCSVVTFGSAIALGVTNPKSQTIPNAAVYAALMAAGGGALVGLLSGSSGQSQSQSAQSQSARSAEESSGADSQTWTDWRNFVVVRKVKESEEITSFYLKPQDEGEIPLFQPGQFLTIKLDIPGQPKPVIRTYSLSDYTNNYYRLSIKREPKPKDLSVPPGIASNFMHDDVREGTIIPAKPPSGKFFVDATKSLPAILVSNGVGITPMITMAKACSQLNGDRPLWFVHGARNGAFHAFRDEVMTLAQQATNLRLHFCYSRPRPEDMEYYHSTGYVDMALLQQYIAPELQRLYGSTEAEYFLCGSPPFLQSLRTGLKEWGVADHRVFFEAFGGPKMGSETKPMVEMQNGAVDASEIVFAKSGQTLQWKPEDGTILEFAEANGLNPEYSCRQGICLTCMCKLREGEVEYETPPDGTPDKGSVLICVSKPKTARIVLDL